jgi:hypothetical protein
VGWGSRRFGRNRQEFAPLNGLQEVDNRSPIVLSNDRPTGQSVDDLFSRMAAGATAQKEDRHAPTGPETSLEIVTLWPADVEDDQCGIAATVPPLPPGRCEGSFNFGTERGNALVWGEDNESCHGGQGDSDGEAGPAARTRSTMLRWPASASARLE